jgi:hypothetical protein
VALSLDVPQAPFDSTPAFDLSLHRLGAAALATFSCFVIFYINPRQLAQVSHDKYFHHWFIAPCARHISDVNSTASARLSS